MKPAQRKVDVTPSNTKGKSLPAVINM